MTTPRLIESLKLGEGLRLKAYRDTEGVWTIGYGHTGLDVFPGLVWTPAQAEAALVKDMGKAIALCDRYLPWWEVLDPDRQDVLAEMMFNMGWGDGKHGLSSFKNTLAKIKAGDYAGAAEGMLASHWADQIKGRAVRLAAQMRTGEPQKL